MTRLRESGAPLVGCGLNVKLGGWDGALLTRRRIRGVVQDALIDSPEKRFPLSFSGLCASLDAHVDRGVSVKTLMGASDLQRRERMKCQRAKAPSRSSVGGATFHAGFRLTAR
jgi:hypothetical protein